MMRAGKFGLGLVMGVVALVMTGSSAMADGAVISGTVYFREKIMLPESAKVSVELADISLADAPAKVLGAVEATGASSPYTYSISYDPSAIEPGHRYSVSARITDGDELLFISTSNNSVFGTDPDTTDILVERVAEAISAASEGWPDGSWLVEDIDGRGVIDNLQTVLVVAADGQVSGTGGCNSIGGKARIDGVAIHFGELFSTEMACAPAIMDQESKFLDALGRAASYRIDAQRDKLILVDAAGSDIMVLAGND
ncbi:META domain-containing protein [Devosia lacusdianchii]|uniref:META domain-containing protein n=1 Tax=Devosia lacusdianchii TaxID=2917991 RepID=UPI001F069247|nr:YbaY family lipoprotein [Devosia sp. JXJ CY 41]